jgi:UTP--glucose-1-phosphate uridylyltransferase
MSKRVRKAIIPAAGYGTRFLPATKSSPKEMMPIVDKPIIQYVVEGAVEAGIEEIIFITSSNKRALEDHFDYNFELEERLKRAGKTEEYDLIRRVSDMAKFIYIRQKEARGTAHAVLSAKEVIGDEPFLVLYGDEFITATPSAAAQMVGLYNEAGGPVVSAIHTDDPADTYRYGYVKTSQENNYQKVEALVEKPGPENAPSKLACVGGYVLTPDIFPIISELPEKNNELYLPEAFSILAQKRSAYVNELKGAQYYDTGSKFGFIKANIDLGLEHSEVRESLLAYLNDLRDAR